MRKATLVKFIDGKCTEEEARAVLDWMDEDKRNRDYLDELKSMIVNTELSGALEPFAVSRRKLSFGRVAAAASVALLFISSLTFSIISLCRKPAEPEQIVRVIDNGEIRGLRNITYYTSRGVKSCVTLPDGSKVTLNSASRLTVPEVFTGKYREVCFSGEGYFEVVHNPENPMIVTTKNGTVEVLGTTFNIRSYDDDEATETTLLSGKVKIKSNEERYSDRYLLELDPMETAVMRHNIAVRQIIKVDTVKTVAWKEGKVIFEEAPMEKVIKELERTHGCNFAVDDSDVLQYVITARFDSKSIREIMEMIKLCSPVNYTMKEDTIHLCISRR